MNIGAKIKNLRLKRGWTLTATSKELGVSVSTYRDWEEGSKISAEQLVHVAELHSTSISQLLGKKQISNEDLARALVCFEEGIEHVKKALAQL